MWKQRFGLIFQLVLLVDIVLTQTSAQEPPCHASQLECKKTRKCIPMMFVCDGEADCGEDDLSDEANCTTTCAVDEMQCHDGRRCIPQRWECDGQSDCADGSDEHNCTGITRTCSADEYLCREQKCIQTKWLCDGSEDCRDGDDELNCTKSCGKLFTCKSNGQCITRQWRCDGEPDCADGSDEEACGAIKCRSEEFQCADNSTCISKRWRCDGDVDCPDQSDEANCNVKTSHNVSVTCTSQEFRCKSGEQCIHANWVCDGDQDCPDGSDESNKCNYTCRADQFTCDDGSCIINTLYCDGSSDCQDGSDEKSCVSTERCADKGMFDCHKNNSHCIFNEEVCDSNIDCSNGADEDPHLCKRLLPCTNTSCGINSRCVNKVTSLGEKVATCECEPGYGWNNGSNHCEDIDECAERGTCSQICINNEGAYTCACHDGYSMENRNFCHALGEKEWLYFAMSHTIRRVSPDTRIMEIVVGDKQRTVTFDIDYSDGVLFWNDLIDDVIISGKVGTNGSVSAAGQTEVYKYKGVGGLMVTGLAVDWLHKNLYWTNNGDDTITVSTYMGDKVKTLINTDLDEPRAICVDPAEGYMYWTDWGENHRIERAGMDGTVRQVLVDSENDVLWPNGLTIDYVARRLYWIDAKLKKIGSARLDGSDIITVLHDAAEIKHPFAITVFEDTLYFTDWHYDAIRSVNKFTGQNVTTLVNQLSTVMDIKVYHEQRQNLTHAAETAALCAACTGLCVAKPHVPGTARDVTCFCAEDWCATTPHTTGEQTWLYFANRGDLQRVTTDTRITEIVVADIKDAVTFDMDYSDGLLFWGDLIDDVINSGKIGTNGSVSAAGQTEVYKYAGLGDFVVAGLAVDWLHKNLYWTNSGDLTITVSNYMGNKTKTLVKTDIEKPRAICVDPEEGYMYWTDWGYYHKIERAGMDGTVRQVLVQSQNDVVWPNGLTIDYVARRLYWIDAKLKKIGSARLDGSDIITVLHDAAEIKHPFAITVFEDTLYFTDWHYDAIRSVNKFTGQNVTTLVNQLSTVMDIKVFHKNRQNLTLAAETAALCAACTGLCVAKPHVPGTARNVTCFCAEDWCATTDDEAWLLFSNRERIFRLGIESQEGKILVDNKGIIAALDIDFKERLLFWIDIKTNVMNSVKITAYGGRSDTEITEVFKHEGNSTFTAEGLAVDWLHKKLYWTNSADKTITVGNYHGNMTKILLDEGLDRPRAICVDPEQGYMYWTDWGGNPRIEKAGMDGSAREVLVDGLDWVNGITIDRVAGRLYWVDAKQDKIGSVLTDGSGITTIRDEEVKHPFGITLFEDTLYYSDWRERQIISVNKFTGQRGSTFASGTGGSNLMVVKVFHRTIQNQTLAAETAALCAACTGLCVAKPHVPGTARDVTCFCAEDWCATTPHTTVKTTTVAANSVSMETTTTSSVTNLTTITTAANRNIKEDTCADKGLFDCHNDSSRCIPYMKVCDRKPDCLHGEDEGPALCRQITLARLFHSMREMKARVERRQLLLAEMKKIVADGRQTEAPTPDWTQLPVQTPAQFDDLEKMLSTSKTLSDLVKRLTFTAAGSSVEAMVTRSMEGLISNSLVSLNYRWRAAMMVVGFRHTKVYTAISRATRRVFPQVLNTEIDDVLEGWLTHSI